MGMDVAAQGRQFGQEGQFEQGECRGHVRLLLSGLLQAGMSKGRKAPGQPAPSGSSRSRARPIMPWLAWRAALIMLPMELILISGLSGSGKSVALNLLEDSGYYCVDNLPVVMLTVLIGMLKEEGIQKRPSPSTPAPGTASICCRRKCRSWRNRAST